VVVVFVTMVVVNDGLQSLHLFLECVDKSNACGSISVAVTMVLMKLLQHKNINGVVKIAVQQNKIIISSYLVWLHRLNVIANR